MKSIRKLITILIITFVLGITTWGIVSYFNANFASLNFVQEQVDVNIFGK